MIGDKYIYRHLSYRSLHFLKQSTLTDKPKHIEFVYTSDFKKSFTTHLYSYTLENWSYDWGLDGLLVITCNTMSAIWNNEAYILWRAVTNALYN